MVSTNGHAAKLGDDRRKEAAKDKDAYPADAFVSSECLFWQLPSDITPGTSQWLQHVVQHSQKKVAPPACDLSAAARSSLFRDETANLVWRYPKRTGWKNVLDGAAAAFMWHYVVWGLFFAIGLVLVSPLVLDMLTWNAIAVLLAVYVTQIVLWQPQWKTGSPRWVSRGCMESPLLNGCFRFGNSTLIREMEKRGSRSGSAELERFWPAGTEEKNTERDGQTTGNSDLRLRRQYVFCFSPHGIIGLCRGACAAESWQHLFPKVFGSWGSFGMAFYLPGFREFSLMVGCVDASRKVLANLPREGAVLTPPKLAASTALSEAARARLRMQEDDKVHSISLLPGGIREMQLSETDRMPFDGNGGKGSVTRHVCLDRNGFVRLAAERKAMLVPVVAFGERWCYEKVDVARFVRGNGLCRAIGIASVFRRLRLALIGIRGQSICLPLPSRFCRALFGKEQVKLFPTLLPKCEWLYAEPPMASESHAPAEQTKTCVQLYGRDWQGLVPATGDGPAARVGRRFLPDEADTKCNLGFAWVFGQAIETTSEDVDALHAHYIFESLRIFEQYKRRFGYSPTDRMHCVGVKYAQN